MEDAIVTFLTQLPFAIGLGWLALRMFDKYTDMRSKEIESQDAQDTASYNIIQSLITPISSLNQTVNQFTAIAARIMDEMKETNAEVAAGNAMLGQIDQRLSERTRQAQVNHATVLNHLEPLRDQSDKFSQFVQGAQGILENLQAGQSLLDQQIKQVVKDGQARDQLLVGVKEYFDALTAQMAAQVEQLSTEAAPEISG